MSDQNNEGAEVKKNKKIRFMSMAEIDKAIEKTQKNQGGLYSRYAKELIKRKNCLSTSAEK